MSVRTLVQDNNTIQSHAGSDDMLAAREFESQNNVQINLNSEQRVEGQVANPNTKQTHSAILTSGDFGLQWQCTCGSNGGTAGSGNMCPHALAVALAAQ